MTQLRVLAVDDFAEHMRMIREQRDQAITKVKDWMADGIIEFTNGHTYGVITPSLDSAHQLRVTWYDEHWLSGHQECDSEEDCINELISTLSYNLQPAPGSLDKLSQTDSWHTWCDQELHRRNLAKLIASVRVKATYISFPRDEFYTLQKRLRKFLPIVTTRVDKEQGKYKAGDVIGSDFGPLKVREVKTFNDLSEHPYFGELTDAQKREIRKGMKGKFDVVVLTQYP